jgi:hypothetical protein
MPEPPATPEPTPTRLIATMRSCSTRSHLQHILCFMPRAKMGYPMNAEEMARKHGRQGLSLRNLLRANPTLTPGHVYRAPYEIYEDDEKRIMGHPGFGGVRRRETS